MIPFWPIDNSFLAATLATLGVELDPNKPYTRIVDANNSGPERTQYLFRDCSSTDNTRRTDMILAAWKEREAFTAKTPEEIALKIAVAPMLSAYAARRRLLGIIHGEPIPDIRESSATYVTPHLREAVLYYACGIPLQSFCRPKFTFYRANLCREILQTSLKTEGRTPQQWIHAWLTNLDRLLILAKDTGVTLKTVEGEKTLLLSADASKKTRDLFFDQMV